MKENITDFSISVVIPVYNRESVIVDALESVRKQTRIDLIKQIIVVDDGSTDDTFFVVERYARNHEELPIEIIKQGNCGVSAARNCGMDNATGDWIALLDSDDEWLPNKIEQQAETIKQNPEIDALGTAAADGGLWILLKHVTELHKIKLYEMLIKSFPVTPSIIFRKSIYERLGGFAVEKRAGEDQEYWHRMLQYYNFYYLPMFLVKCGHGKNAFGDGGLSNDLLRSNEEHLDNLYRLLKRRQISVAMFHIFRLWFLIKHYRRVCIIEMRKNYMISNNRGVQRTKV